MKHTDIKEVFSAKEYGKKETICGWVRTARDSKNVAFIELNDGTTLKHIQVVIDKEKGIEYSDEAMKLGASLKVVGELVEGRQGYPEINAEEITVIGKCPQEYPLQKKRHTLEFLRTMPHLRGRTNTFNAVFRVRSVAADAIHRYFQEKGFTYVNTPLITGSDCEGAGEMFQVTTTGFTDKYKSEEEYWADDFFGKKAGLSVSGQLEGEVAAMAFGKI